ncbi:hypothetical protein KSD_79570 [Ktedonobacter sp. SOSP1-85]|nr:hypothetical protein KSD_79570 [Ktedonobacter sp. SOSP1-85]
MHTHEAPAYGLWLLVIINAGVFILFAFSFVRPRTTRDWRSFGIPNISAFRCHINGTHEPSCGIEAEQRMMPPITSRRTDIRTQHRSRM